jgi:hypothetical protein
VGFAQEVVRHEVMKPAVARYRTASGSERDQDVTFQARILLLAQP